MDDVSNEESLETHQDDDNNKNGSIDKIMEYTPIKNDEDKLNLFETTENKLNGSVHSSDDADNDSETDALIIDESLPKKKLKKRKRIKTKSLNNEEHQSGEEIITNELVIHSNPYFNESIFELSLQHQDTPTQIDDKLKNTTKLKTTKNGPQLREYAQYLGLQPAVQFKCSKCFRAGFESLPSLNEHFKNCNGDPSVFTEIENNSTTSFKLTRKVFLCSACGTYYENWNLYIHMLEHHKRYICLYCLGMFSILDDLCQHIQNRHNCEPQQHDTPEDFFKEYKEPCFLICCDCKKLFNEQDNFFYHKCLNKSDKNKIKCIKQQILPENHVTGDSNDTNQQTIIPQTIQQDNKEETIIKETEIIKTPDKFDRQENESTTPKLTVETNIQPSNIMTLINQDDDIDTVNSPEEINENLTPPTTQTTTNEDWKEYDKMNGEEDEHENEFIETRKVPKLSLKLPKLTYDHEDSDDSTKLDMDIDQIESEIDEPQIPIAGNDINIVELELEQPLDKFDIKILLQKCLLATVPLCIYCNHARKIAVNGKQLGLHAIAQHRYSGVVNSITAEELIPESFVDRIKNSLDELNDVYFNLETNFNEEAVTFSHIFECFQCRYATSIHKELYLHNRKMHTKNLLLCIMCKSNFYNYSELICHLCPGDYILDHDVQFRCCMCFGDNLPSAFRLMVHLRKRHHVCDVCLEMCNNQYKLSNHVWKHKLHHFCYRCGIAYRNKQDITRHLFWKHGTESVLCKKCLQKKWPHVFHFCIPPQVFTCEECNLNFTKAVYLKVHKRLHTNDKPHQCTYDGCEEKFISKKLKEKHEIQHYQPMIQEEKLEEKEEDEPEQEQQIEVDEIKQIDVIEQEEKPKPKVDVYDLPELNLSESSDSESELNEEIPKEKNIEKNEEDKLIETLNERTLEIEKEIANLTNDIINKPEETFNSIPIDSVWDGFKMYQANKEKNDNLFGETEQIEPEIEKEPILLAEIALRDHDYIFNPENCQDTNVITEAEPDLSQRVDHDYCTVNEIDEKKIETETPTKEIIETIKKPEPVVDSTSSDSDSSNCSCGTNCSCSSSSSSSSSSDSSDSDSSTEEGRRKQQVRREKRRNKKIINKEEQQKEEKIIEINKELPPPLEIPILEIDLSTTESETDEEFYDKQPLKLAKKLLEEKRNQLLAEVGSLPNGSNFFENSRNSTPSLPEEVKPKKKSKSKKRKKKKSERKELLQETTNVSENFYQTQPMMVAPITISLNKVAPMNIEPISPKIQEQQTPENENLRSSKRRRVPNKFYGYSSDEDGDKKTPSKWRKVELPQTPVQQQLLVPPLMIKTTPIIQKQIVEPITIKTTAKPGELRVHQKQSTPKVPPLQINTSLLPKNFLDDHDSCSDSNESTTEEPEPLPFEPPKEAAKTAQLYCYCRCPYDEVSEMIGCDSHDCAIEWFHFECVGIMVPPKGQWFCPDCRKRKQQRREMLQV